MKKSLIIVCLGLLGLFSGAINAQTGGKYIYEFLNITGAPRVGGVGGTFLPVFDNDVFLGLHNPSLISEDMHNQLGLSFLDYFADISAGNAVYSRTFEKYGSFIGAVQFLNYGTFTYADPTGTQGGEFGASDVAINIGWGREVHPGFRIGADIKGIFSSYESYNAFALSTDISASYISDSKNFVATVQARNVGRQLDDFSGSGRENMPFEIQAGISKKLEHAPFRFFVLLNNLQTWDLNYEDPQNPNIQIDPITGEIKEVSKLADFTDNLFRHTIFGAEIANGKLLSLRIGYNYRLRQEMGVQSRMSTVGISWGFGLKLGRYQFDYSRSHAHLAGSPNYFSIRTHIGKKSK